MSSPSDPPAGTPLPPEGSGSLPARRPRAALPSAQRPDGQAAEPAGGAEGSPDSWFTPRGRQDDAPDYPAGGGYPGADNAPGGYSEPGYSGAAANGFAGQQPRGNGGQGDLPGWQPPGAAGQQPGSFGGFPGQAPGGFGSPGQAPGGYRSPEPGGFDGHMPPPPPPPQTPPMPQRPSAPHRSPAPQTPPPSQTPPWSQAGQGYPGQQSPGRPGDSPTRGEYLAEGDHPTRGDFPALGDYPQPSFQPAQPNGFPGAQPGGFPPSGPKAYPGAQQPGAFPGAAQPGAYQSAPPAGALPGHQPTLAFSDPAQPGNLAGQWPGAYPDQQYGGYPGYQQGTPPGYPRDGYQGYPPQDGYQGYPQQDGYQGYPPQDGYPGFPQPPGAPGTGRRGGGKLSRRNRWLIAGAAVVAVLAVAGVFLTPKLLGSTDPGCKAYTGTALTAYNKTIDDLNRQAPQATLTGDMTRAINKLKAAVGQAQSASAKSALNGLLAQLKAVSGDMRQGAVPAGTVSKLNAAATTADNAC